MEDDMLMCPYDSSHLINVLRMPRHLLRCRKNHPSMDLKVCPFNGFHEVPAPELRYHMEHCPDKALLDRDAHLFGNKTRVKGFTELPESRDHELCGEGDEELWDSEQLEDRSNLQRSRLRSRMRHEEGTRLRLPNREGIAARLANSLLAVEKSGHESISGDVDSDERLLSGQQPHRGCSRLQDQSYRNHGVVNGCSVRDSTHLETSPSVLSNCVPQSSYMYDCENEEHDPCDNIGIIKKDLSERRKDDHHMPDLISIGAQRSEPVPACKLSQETSTPVSKLPITQSEPKKTLQELNYHAFMIGRGRANPLFTSKSSLGQRTVGRGAALDPASYAAQSKKLTQLAYSLGRGRGLNKTFNPSQNER
ncbi:hypothetical protein EGW08_020372 [Elysia chlorotica]|uniref:CHHC U11-48K-type domain-containing protein n=1 Tax=Elysia chlorotica TaxID=188477 RepID=A0A433SRX0_ELYCH|nr:hypothetical protein EGW08_020372 [Elysia chlorotica]